MKILKTNFQFFKYVIPWKVWLIVFIISKSVVSNGMADTFIICHDCFWAKTFGAWIRLLTCSRMELISFYLLLMSYFSSLFSVSKSLILVYKLSTVPWSILVEVFQIFADVSDSFFMVWSSYMKNYFKAMILSNSFASSESSCELNDELITEFEWNGRGVEGVTNDPIFGIAIAASDMWFGMTRFIVALI